MSTMFPRRLQTARRHALAFRWVKKHAVFLDGHETVQTMSAYRNDAPRATELETRSIHDLRNRMTRLRKRVALPVAIASMALGWAGATMHVTGRWSLFGALPDGRYFVNAFTMAIAAALIGGPVAAFGVLVYVVKRASLRHGWREAYRREKVADAWPDREEFLARTMKRFS